MKNILIKADSGSLQHFYKHYDMKLATDQVVNFPNNKVVTSSFKGQIPASSVISKKSLDANVFKYIHRAYMIYLLQLCDYGRTDILD